MRFSGKHFSRGVSDALSLRPLRQAIGMMAMRLNRADTNTSRHLRDRAAARRQEANAELDPKKRQQLRDLAADLEQQARDAEKLRMRKR